MPCPFLSLQYIVKIQPKRCFKKKKTCCSSIRNHLPALHLTHGRKAGLPTLTSGPSPASGPASLHLIPNTLFSRLASDTVDNTNARFLTHPLFLKSSSPRSHIYAHSPNCFRFLLNDSFPSRRSSLQALQFSSFFSIAFMTTW